MLSINPKWRARKHECKLFLHRTLLTLQSCYPVLHLHLLLQGSSYYSTRATGDEEGTSKYTAFFDQLKNEFGIKVLKPSDCLAIKKPPAQYALGITFLISGSLAVSTAAITGENDINEAASTIRELEVEHLIVVVEISDSEWSEASFVSTVERASSAVKSQGHILLKTKLIQGFDTKSVAFVPVLSVSGDNMTRRSSKMPGYYGWSVDSETGPIMGVTLLDAIKHMTGL